MAENQIAPTVAVQAISRSGMNWGARSFNTVSDLIMRAGAHPGYDAVTDLSQAE